MQRLLKNAVFFSVADPDHFDADPDPTSEKNRMRIRIPDPGPIMLYIKFCNKIFLLNNKAYLLTENLE
jgi:hypothetical protein